MEAPKNKEYAGSYLSRDVAGHGREQGVVAAEEVDVHRLIPHSSNERRPSCFYERDPWRQSGTADEQHSGRGGARLCRDITTAVARPPHRAAVQHPMDEYLHRRVSSESVMDGGLAAWST